MEWIEEVDPFHLETLTTLQKYQQAQPTEQERMRGDLDETMNEVALRTKEEGSKKSRKSYKVYSADQKVLFLYYLQVKLCKAAKAARLSGVTERTGQQWAKRLKDEPEWDIFEKQTNKDKQKTGMLQEEHKEYIINLYDQNPQACGVDIVDSLTKSFENFSLKETSARNFMKTECNLSFKRATLRSSERNSEDKLRQRFEWVERWTSTDMDYLFNCVFVDESGFDINIRPPSAWSTVGTPAIVETKSTKVTSHTILGTISAIGVVDIELRVAAKPKQRRIDRVGRKRKQTPNVKKPKETTTGHYLNFIRKTLDEMDKNPLMNGFYIVMDNVPIHTHNDIDELITSRGYRSIYLPPHSPELNPIEQFWSVTRIADACNNVPIQHVKAFIQHSCDQFEKCRTKEPI
ncbi:hypothetical protein G6F57_010311 [Rhizopus arrhizus]|uniref:Tc1-like transposase DDE domain-containing protein n=1 Tax=Rhizopus oryzae TaxID=64495 RepID=A0A9P6X2Z9_RHIOR|nr:hypothetical protein G6F33_011074 [Rhizopus arrhizus]KAG1398787.1 hypothetical protein G6F58_011251 [Rhizopus delemar]KAG0932580.1 hypothetical protein G6F30_010680 [Rhizopus arrhizus]KAG0936294.1 hypothetical protein G6F32_010151 [Rhizopus arrhizus]KAG0976435.1 hypothetical protein G6F29_010801 [Rhizopus arrhizus]